MLVFELCVYRKRKAPDSTQEGSWDRTGPAGSQGQGDVRQGPADNGVALGDRADSAVPHNQGVGVVAGHGVSGVCAAGPGGRDREAGSLVATTGHGLIGIDTETNAGVSGTGSSAGLSATTEARCESRWRLASSTDLVLEDSQLP